MQTGSPLPLIILIVAAILAIAESDRKWRTTGYILLSCAIGLGIGAAAGAAMGNLAAGGTLAGVLTVVCGILTSIREYQASRKRKRDSTPPPPT